jgi:ATP adenylyltransferase
MKLEKGSLLQNIVKTAQHAREIGALLPIPTSNVYIQENGVKFSVRVLAGLKKKDRARKEQEAASEQGKDKNPFLPPEKDLVISDISDTHLAVLNKFNVVDKHLLIITKRFVQQDMLLTREDFDALWLCMDEFPALGFYNGGREAGASQQHRHLQMVPLPIAPEGPAVPIAPLLAEAPRNRPCSIPGFSFLHAFMSLDREFGTSPQNAAVETFSIYSSLLNSVGMTMPAANGLSRQSRPYCLLITREWMLLVPRSQEFFEDISINSLAYAGSFFVRDEQQLARLKTAGPLNVLKSVSIPA